MLAYRIGLLLFFGVISFPLEDTARKQSTVRSIGPSPEVVLTGRITDKVTGSPLEGAQVSVDGGALGAVTDLYGVYTLNLPDSWAGRRITIVVQFLGYATNQREVRLSEGPR